MGKFRLTVRTNFGEIAVEGDSLNELEAMLSTMGIPQTAISNLIETIKQKLQAPEVTSSIIVAPSKPEAVGVIEYGSNGNPHITVPSTKLTAREVIGLILYAKSPNAVSMGELTELVAQNWQSVEMPYVSAALSHMRAYIIKEGTRGSFSYKLSGSGRSWIENELLPKLKLKSEAA